MKLILSLLVYYSAGAINRGISLSTGYIAGALIAFLIMCYLVYSLIKPEKF